MSDNGNTAPEEVSRFRSRDSELEYFEKLFSTTSEEGKITMKKSKYLNK